MSQLLALSSTPRRGAEIGVSRGKFSSVLLREFPFLTLTMVDSWSTFALDHPYRLSKDGHASLTAEQQAGNRAAAMESTAFAADRRQVIEEDSSLAARRVADESLDFVFIDADHTYEAVARDLAAWWPKVRPGGIFSGHDYIARRDRQAVWGVARATDEFAKRVACELRVLPHKVWVIQKPESPSSAALPPRRMENFERPPAIIGSRRSPGQIVRVLFGNLDEYPKLKREVIASLASEWARELVLHMVAGASNRDLLLAHGAKRVVLVSDSSSLVAPDWYLHDKVRLISEAMKEHSEILYLDFDCKVHKRPDDEMWSILRNRAQSGSDGFMASNVQYVRRILLPIHRTRGIHNFRHCLNTSAIYCSKKEWFDDWLLAYQDVANRRYRIPKNDEVLFMHMLDGKCGVLEANEMVKRFEIPILRLRRAIAEAKAFKRSDEVYFSHR